MIIKKFEEQVERHFNSTALKKAGRIVTYGQLNANADRIAHAITSITSMPGQSEQVALLFEHGIDMVIAIIATLKANKTYVPLDVHYPHKRLLYILENSQTSLILTNQQNEPLAHELTQLSTAKLAVLNIETINEDAPSSTPQRDVSPDKIAYIIYTSGSTGNPKGVYQTHQNVWYYTRNWVNRFGITANDRMSLFTALTHDGAVQDIFSALLTGAALYPYSLKENGNLDELYLLLLREKITIWHSVPSLFRFFANGLSERDLFYDIRWVLLGGEPLREHDLQLFNAYYPHATLANIYGQTESSVSTTCCITREQTFDDVTLGEPLDETTILLVREDGNIVDTMGVGEITVASQYLAPGYWRDPANTEKVFTPDDELGRIYWTGDLGRMTAAGTIKMMGRKDFQVKIRGFRVETGEVETILLNYPAIKEVVVVAKTDEQGDYYLCAYYVASERPSVNELRQYLAQELPDYMVPRFFMALEQMPQTGTGKIDRNMLPEPTEATTAPTAYVAPTNEIEQKVAAIWEEILGVEKVGIYDNFIQLGGHSLLIVSIRAKIHQIFDVELQLTDLFNNPTVKDQAQLIQAANPSLFLHIEPAEQKEYYILSSAQKRLYILQQLLANNTGYNMPFHIILNQEIDKEKVEAIFKQLIARHESLRTSFIIINNEPVQVIHPHVDFSIGMYEVKDEQEAYRLKESMIKPFDLSQAPLMRVNLISISGSAQQILTMDLHHIITDGTSQGILNKEFAMLMAGETLSPLPLQYKDYTEWFQNTTQQHSFQKQETYWLNKYSGEIPILNIPTDFPRPMFQSFEGNIAVFYLTPEETEAIRTIAQRNDATIYMSILAIFNVLLAKLSGQEDIIVGTPVATRRHIDLEKVIGILLNTLAIRNEPRAEKTFKEFLQDVRERTLAAYENQDYPFEMLVDRITVNRDTSRNPIFDIMFNSMNHPDFESEQSLPPSAYQYKHLKGNSKFDLNLSSFEFKDTILINLEYSTNLFKPTTINRILDYFRNIIHLLVSNDEIKIAEINMLSETEKEEILQVSCGEISTYESAKTIHQLFAEQVEKTPTQVAITYTGDNPHYLRSLTYQQLNEQADRLASLLQERGAKPGSIIALMVERSVHMLVGLFGILKAGCAYLPLDPQFPSARIAYILQHSQAAMLVSEQAILAGYGDLPFSGQIIDIIKDIPASRSTSIANTLNSNDPAYVIYTSGSTGIPKGVTVSHRNALNFISAITKRIPFNPGQTILAVTTVSFDIFFLETLLPLTRGLTVAIVDEESQKDPQLLTQIITTHKIDILQMTPSRLLMLAAYQEDLPCLATVSQLLIGGEAFPPHLLTLIKKNYHRQLYNVYGPTETTVWSTVKDLSSATAELTIGTPIANTHVYIVNASMQLQPKGIPGELLIGGDSVALGYHHNTELTNEKFINSPFIPGDRLYKTGDLARWLPTNELEFLGRMDFQVKIRGYRIELAEIETYLSTHPAVAEAIILAPTNEDGKQYLAAYIVPHVFDDPNLPTVSTFREYLAIQLPDYMIPDYFMILEKWPLTPNGKIDRRALAALNPGVDRPSLKEEYVAPSSQLETTLADLWKEVLKIEKVGINDNFFELGGNSMAAVTLTNRLRDVLQRDIPVVTLFRFRTIRTFVNYLNQEVDLSELTSDRSEALKKGEARKRRKLQNKRGEEEIDNE